MLALLPGSRLGEIERNLPIMLETFSLLKVDKAIIPAANERAKEKIDSILTASTVKPSVEVRLGGARELLLSARAALVASGTATGTGMVTSANATSVVVAVFGITSGIP